MTVEHLTALPTRDGGRRRYDDLVARASQANVGGVIVAVTSLSDIIDSKTWANRPKDHQALPELLALQRRSDEAG